MTNEELRAELLAVPGHELIVWAALYEDVYETVHGDGYYAYFADAFFSRAEAERFASTFSAYRFHVRKIHLCLRCGEITVSQSDLKPFETVDVAALVAALSHDPTPREPKKQY